MWALAKSAVCLACEGERVGESGYTNKNSGPPLEPTDAMRKLALRTIVLVLSFGLVPLATNLAHAQDGETKIGVTVSAVINAQPHVGPRVSAALGNALRETLIAQVLAGPDAQARLPEAARSETCLGESSCLVSAGKALEVDQLLMLIIVGVGDELKIEATWVDVSTGETALRPGITTADTDAAMRAAFTAKAKELLPGVEARATTTVVTPTDVTKPPEGNGNTGGGGSLLTPKTKSDTGTAKLLMYGGGALVAGWVGYGGYQLIDRDWSFDCPASETCTRGRDVAIDIVLGGLGTAALSAGLYMYLSADGEEAPAPSPVGFNVGSDSLQLSYGGRF